LQILRLSRFDCGTLDLITTWDWDMLGTEIAHCEITEGHHEGGLRGYYCATDAFLRRDVVFELGSMRFALVPGNTIPR